MPSQKRGYHWQKIDVKPMAPICWFEGLSIALPSWISAAMPKGPLHREEKGRGKEGHLT